MEIKKPLWKNKFFITGIFVIALVGGFIAYTAATKKQPAEPVLPPVKAGNKVIAQGVVAPVQYAALGLQTSGIVGEISVAEGDNVKKGQLLLRLQNQDLQARVGQARVSLSKAEANLVSVRENRPRDIANGEATVKTCEASLQTAGADYNRTKLLCDQGAATVQQLEQAKVIFLKAEADLEKAKADLEQLKADSGSQTVAAAEADVAIARAALDQAQTALEQTGLRAPFAGTVTKIEPRVGENVVAGAPVVQLGDLSEWRIETDDLTELDIANIRMGAPASLTFEAVPDLEIHGTVIKISPFGEKKKGDMTYTVVIKPDHSDDRLRWNMTASVTINK